MIMFGRKLCGRDVRIGFLLIALALLCTAASAFTIDGHTFNKGVSHVINGVGGTPLSYYQTYFYLNNTTGLSNGNTIYTNGMTVADWRDIRFTDANNTVYPHYIESINSTSANVWVNITSIPSTGTMIRMYWNSSTAPQTSNGSSTFYYYDDFGGTTVDTVKWTKTGSPTVSNGIVTLPQGVGITSTRTFLPGYATRMRVAIPIPEYGTINLAGGTLNFGAAHTNRIDPYTSTSLGQFSNPSSAMAIYFCARTSSSTIFGRGTTPEFNSTVGYVSTAQGISAAGGDGGVPTTVDWVEVLKYNSDGPTQGEYSNMDPPIATFSTNVTTGYVPLAVKFTDQSINAPTTWTWNFGDGQTSIEQNPTHIFSEIGVYTVSLTTANAYGSDDESKVEYITVTPPPPVTAFAANQSTGQSPLVVQFTDQSTNSPTAWSWTFGDGQTSTEQSPTHTFTALGSYTVSLTATNAIGSDDETKVDYISVVPAAPVAAFSAGPIAGAAPLTVSFVDTSTETPTSWAWDFTEDGTADSVEQNPTHTYAANGTYSVTLQVSNAGGTDIITKTDLVYVGPLTANYLKASFRYTGITGAGGSAPYAVTFTDTTRTDGGTYAREWDFGDGETSTEANPTHVYTDSGKFDVGLSVHSATRTNSVGYKKIINIYPKTAITPLPTNTYGAHMTQIMETDFNIKNVSEIIQIIPMAYTDVIPPTLFWGMLFITAFFMMFVRQGTPWLIGLLAILIGGEITVFTAPEWQMLGWGMMAVSLGGFLYVLYKGRYRSD